MDPVINLKTAVPVEYDCCIICQESRRSKTDVIFNSTPQGIASLKEATASRKKLPDYKFRDTVDRLTSLFSDSASESIPILVWHKSCFAIYTSKEKIERLKKQSEVTPSTSKSLPSTATSSSSQSTPRLRSSSKPTDWTLCLFCQQISKQKLCNVSTMNMSDNILSAAKYIEDVCVRVADVNDLVAAEGRYHSNCYKRFMRNSEKAKNENKTLDLAMVWLTQELRTCADKGHVLDLAQVWERYNDLAKELCIDIPHSYVSRLSTFKEKLLLLVYDVYDYIVLRDRAPDERQTLLVPIKYSHIPISKYSGDNEEVDDEKIPVFRSNDDEFMSMVHVALRLRGDIQSHPTFRGVDVSEQAAIDCVPPSLYTFLRLLIGGQSILLEDPDEDELGEQETHKQMRVLSIGQDIVYNVSGGRKLTPKHVGLGLSIHEATRSKKLVTLLHRAGHIISYKEILHIDTALAENTLVNMNRDNGAVVPPNLTEGRFVHFTADNIDINDSTLDGKNTFHATQVAAWQRGPAENNLLSDIEPSTSTSLKIPEAMESIIPAGIVEGTTKPKIDGIQEAWFTKSDNTLLSCPSALEAESRDMAFIIIRHFLPKKPSWTTFNQTYSTNNPEKSLVGFMPIIQAPAHDISTLNTVVQRAIYVADSMKQKHVVITVDQALFPALMELKWARYNERLIPRLGGLHISMNFLKVLGQHTADSGLADVWTESGLLGPNSAEKALSGKSYAKGVRAHKLTLQALWQILLPELLNFFEENDSEMQQSILSEATKEDGEGIEPLERILGSTVFHNQLASFVKTKEDDPNFIYWWQYLEMVCILLKFIRAQRDGVWNLHLFAFRQMLPYFHRYDHTNYARWGPVYLAEMHRLPPEVEDEFQKGNFVVKGSHQRFNQVDPDHSQEWLNAVGKKGGGIVGITKTTSALSRWALSYNLRACIASQTRDMFDVGLDEHMVHNENTASRTKRDNDDEDKLVTVMKHFNIFNQGSGSSLVSLATKDVTTTEIQESLINAENIGQNQVNTFIKDRLIECNKSLRDPLQRSKALTFTSLYEVKKVSKAKELSMKADRNVLQRLITAYQAGRSVDLDMVLRHELMKVPLSLANTDGTLRTGGTKSILTGVLTKDVDCPTKVTFAGSSCLVIDGQAAIVALGKPSHVSTFGQLADAFNDSIMNAGKNFDRIDVTFDRYRETSIKSTTRVRRTKKSRPVRRMIENREVPLPNKWSDFLALPENKRDLSIFLSEQLVTYPPKDKILVVAGGFEREDEVKTTDPLLDTELLQANHEEADTRVVLHSIHADVENIVVSARDTDILVLLIAHIHHMKCKTLWLKAGTYKTPKYIPGHEIRKKLNFEREVFERLIPFHAITGCDTVSYLSGHSKKTSWEVFLTDNNLLEGIGKGELTENKMKEAEMFICKIYKVPKATSCDQARVTVFCKCKSTESLPPTSDATRYHIQRAHFQSLIWLQAVKPKPLLPSPTDMGWKLVDEKLVPTLGSLPPIPESCKTIISCGCKKGCTSSTCSCRKGKLKCTGACMCADSDQGCKNR